MTFGSVTASHVDVDSFTLLKGPRNPASSKLVDPSGELHLVDLVASLVRAAADSERGLIRSLTLNGAFVAVQRGSAAIDDTAAFDLDDFTCIG